MSVGTKQQQKGEKNMKKLSFFSLLGAAFLFSYLVGCNENSISPEETDDQFIESVVRNGIGSGEEDDLMSTEVGDLDTGAVENGGGFDTPIDSLMKWGRRITSVSINISISNQGDTIKNVTVTRTITGNYIIIGIVLGQVDTIVKPYTEVMNRLAIFKRIDRTPYPRRNWRLYKVSMLDGQTTQPQVGSDYVKMNKIEVWINGTLTYTFLGPDFTQNWFTTRYFGGPGIPEVHRGDQVNIKVFTYSTQPEPDIVAWHWARNTFGFHRVPFDMTSNVPNGSGWDRTYEKNFTVYGTHPFRRANGYISASTHKSLYDDSPAEFASDLVGTPYRVIP